MGPFEMVVAIILIVTVGKIISAKQKAKHGIIKDEDMLGNKTQRSDRQQRHTRNAGRNSCT